MKPEVLARYNDDVQAAIAGVNVWQADCHGYYRTASGRIVTQWPFSMIEYDERTAGPRRRRLRGRGSMRRSEAPRGYNIIRTRSGVDPRS